MPFYSHRAFPAALLTIIIPQILGEGCLMRYSSEAGQIYSQNVLFPGPLTAARSLLSARLLAVPSGCTTRGVSFQHGWCSFL